MSKELIVKAQLRIENFLRLYYVDNDSFFSIGNEAQQQELINILIARCALCRVQGDTEQQRSHIQTFFTDVSQLVTARVRQNEPASSSPIFSSSLDLVSSLSLAIDPRIDDFWASIARLLVANINDIYDGEAIKDIHKNGYLRTVGSEDHDILLFRSCIYIQLFEYKLIEAAMACPNYWDTWAKFIHQHMQQVSQGLVKDNKLTVQGQLWLELLYGVVKVECATNPSDVFSIKVINKMIYSFFFAILVPFVPDVLGINTKGQTVRVVPNINKEIPMACLTARNPVIVEPLINLLKLLLIDVLTQVLSVPLSTIAILQADGTSLPAENFKEIEILVALRNHIVTTYHEQEDRLAYCFAELAKVTPPLSMDPDTAPAHAIPQMLTSSSSGQASVGPVRRVAKTGLFALSGTSVASPQTPTASSFSPATVAPPNTPNATGMFAPLTPSPSFLDVFLNLFAWIFKSSPQVPSTPVSNAAGSSHTAPARIEQPSRLSASTSVTGRSAHFQSPDVSGLTDSSVSSQTPGFTTEQAASPLFSSPELEASVLGAPIFGSPEIKPAPDSSDAPGVPPSEVPSAAPRDSVVRKLF